MSPKRWTVAALALSLAGCHHGLSAEKPATDVVALYLQLQSMWPPPKEQVTLQTGLDLRSETNQTQLRAHLKLYNAVLDRAQAVLRFPSYPKAFMPATGKVTPDELDVGAFCKGIIVELLARARLNYATGEEVKGLTDLLVAARIANHFNQNIGSWLQAIFGSAIRQTLLGGLRRITLDAAIDAPADRDIAKVAESVAWVPKFKSAVKVESKVMTPETAQQRAEFALVIPAIGDESDPRAVLTRLRAVAPKVENSSGGIANISVSRLALESYESMLKSVADARMTVAFFQALALNSEKGHFPVKMPTSGALGRDPFTGGSFVYRATLMGFQISSEGEYRAFPSNPHWATMTYPLPRKINN